MDDDLSSVDVVQPGRLLLSCLALQAFAFGDRLVYLLRQWKLFGGSWGQAV